MRILELGLTFLTGFPPNRANLFDALGLEFWTEHDPKYIRLSLPKHHTFAQKMNFESEPCKEKIR